MFFRRLNRKVINQYAMKAFVVYEKLFFLWH